MFKEMFKDLGPKRKFGLMLISIYVISLPIISALTYFILKGNAVRDAYNLGRLRLSTMEAVKGYVDEELSPVLYYEMPGRFILEGIGPYAAGAVARRVFKEHPGYKYINASLNPRDSKNVADEFEAGIINTFISNSEVREWQGFRTRPEGEYYVIARAGEPLTADCLLCHSDPAVSPQELVEIFGPTAGFNMKIGQFMDAKFVYIPIDMPLAAARKVVALFIGIYTVFFAIIFLIIDVRFTGLYNTIESDKKRIEDINLELMNLNHDMESICTERTLNLIALSVADRIRNPVTAIGGTFNRILKKETISEPLKERMTNLLIEAQKLDSIVKDYETILKSRQIMFKVEDLNKITQSVLPLVEREMKEKNIELSLKLSESPLRFVANRQLLRVAILHIIKNAMEATPPGGTITIIPTSNQDYVTLSVIDTGKGIPEEDIQKIFSLFYSTKKHRMGMGLPLVKQIMDEHKGDIKVESGLGKGTTFRLIFPVRWSEQELEGKEE